MARRDKVPGGRKRDSSSSSAAVSIDSRQGVPKRTPSETKALICFNYMDGRCEQGADCEYAHRSATDEQEERKQQAEEKRRVLDEVRRTKLCPHSASAKCTHGRGCTVPLLRSRSVSDVADPSC